MEKFRIIQPSPILASYVRHYWILQSDDVINSQRIIPTGAVNMIAVVFHPFGAKVFFNIPIYELFGLSVSADDIRNISLKELDDKILNTSDDIMCISMIEKFLISRMNPIKDYNYKRIEAIVKAINLGCTEISVSNLDKIACLGNKQFHRVFSEHVGSSPKDFIMIIRFHKALFILQNNPLLSFTELSYECGYYDQSHLTNEFKLFSGYTPGEYIGVCNPHSDYFSSY